jgi:hypothetical protein
VRENPRPDAAAHVVDRLTPHRRRLRLDGRDYPVIPLTPGTDARFSTDHFHHTWHVPPDWHGRLRWGLAFQKVPGSLVRRFLNPNPFESIAADPVALASTRSTQLSSRVARESRRLPLDRMRPDATVRWQTHSLEAEITSRRPRYEITVGAHREPWIPRRRFPGEGGPDRWPGHRHHDRRGVQGQRGRGLPPRWTQLPRHGLRGRRRS